MQTWGADSVYKHAFWLSSCYEQRTKPMFVNFLDVATQYTKQQIVIGQFACRRVGTRAHTHHKYVYN
jgi:hypothetical protein